MLEFFIHRTWAIFFAFPFKLLTSFEILIQMNFPRINHCLRFNTNTFWSERSVQTSERCAFVNQKEWLSQKKIVVFFDKFCSSTPFSCSHFRDGTFTYKPVNPSNHPANTLTVSFRDQTTQRICTMSTTHGNFCVLFTRLIFIMFLKEGNSATIGFYWFAKRLSLEIAISTELVPFAMSKCSGKCAQNASIQCSQIPADSLVSTRFFV